MKKTFWLRNVLSMVKHIINITFANINFSKYYIKTTVNKALSPSFSQKCDFLTLIGDVL